MASILFGSTGVSNGPSAAADAFDGAAIALMAGCGLRWGEAMGLHRHRLDRERGWLRVVETWDSKVGRIKAYPKGKKSRDVPVPDWVG
jgi:integrase